MSVPTDPAAVPIAQPKKKSKRKLILIVVGLLSACCILSIIGVILSPSTPKTATPEVAGVSKTKSSPTQGEAAVKEKPTEPPAPTETAAPETKDIYMVGEKASQAGIAITVLNVQKVNKLQLLTADAGKTYLDIEVLIENVSRDETTPYNSFYFKIKDDTAAEYTTTMDSLTPSLKSAIW